MTTHSGCCLDYPEDVALAYTTVRGHELVLASARNDDAGREATLAAIGDCDDCLRNMVAFLAGLAESLGVGMAENAGADRAAAIRQFERGLAAAKAKLS
ncbi:hypothetical protein [Mycolicibacterium porcinum]|uniref:hypothetical protein n=1 Tax=Mycolicibacterium porcinum TaxID=39693 RepID=UPI0010422973|nr:hypothetical protein [Mycolicibacterium porcinum]